MWGLPPPSPWFLRGIILTLHYTIFRADGEASPDTRARRHAVLWKRTEVAAIGRITTLSPIVQAMVLSQSYPDPPAPATPLPPLAAPCPLFLRLPSVRYDGINL